MADKQSTAPDSTAVRTALWRALHVEIDEPPHVFEDVVGLQLAAPEDDWRSRPDMTPFTRPFRASIVARARFVEDVVAEEGAHGVEQYVILGAGLDTFAQRRRDFDLPVACIRDRSAWTAGMETTATRRASLRCAVVLATGAGGF